MWPRGRWAVDFCAFFLSFYPSLALSPTHNPRPTAHMQNLPPLPKAPPAAGDRPTPPTPPKRRVVVIFWVWRR